MAARPTAVTILGWVFAGYSVFVLLSSGLFFAFTHFMSGAIPGGEFRPGSNVFPASFENFFWVFDVFVALTLVQSAAAAFSIYAAIMFLKVRPWARTYFEVLNWIVLVQTILFGVFFAVIFGIVIASIGPTSAPSKEALPPGLIGVFGVFGVFVALFTTLFSAVLPAGFIWLLRSRFVRPAFDRHATS